MNFLHEKRLKLAIANIRIYTYNNPLEATLMAYFIPLKKNFIFLAFAILSFSTVSGQGTVSNDTLAMSLFQIQAGVHQPFGDMGELYGTGASIGFSFAIKTKKNWLWGSDFNYMFGDNVKNTDQIITELRNSVGNITGINGEPVNFLLLQRGYTGGLYVGKIFPIIGPNPNSGLVVKLGVDYFEHRTWIETRQDEFPPLEGEYRKGYDRKRAGFALYEFVGYQHFSDNKYANFFVGFECYQAFTVDYRSYNFDDMDYTNGDYFDLMVGFKIGWVIPVYKRVANKFYLD